MKSHYISYRDDDFDDSKSPAIEEARYKILLTRALSAQPQNDTEREILEDYINIIQQIIACYEEINNIIRLINGLYKSSDTAKRISLEESYREKLAVINSREQELFVLEHSYSGLLKRVFERNNERPRQSEGQNTEKRHYTTRSIKEKLIETLGAFGGFLYVALRLLVCILPFVMIGGNFFLNLLLIGINTFVPFSSIVFWIWGLVCAIKGVQDFWSILYYVAFVVMWLPFFISTVISAISNQFSKSQRGIRK